MFKPLIDKSKVKIMPENKNQAEKYLIKYDDLIEVRLIKNSDIYNSLRGHTATISCVAISQDGKFLVSASFDKTIKVWNIEERKEEFTLKGHTSFVKTVAPKMGSFCQWFRW